MTKYIGPKTADENVATQADKLSLSSATPDALTPDQAGAAGTATTAARSDHQHEILAGAAGTILPDDAAAEGTSSSFARADHTHAITAASAGTITGTNSEGTASSFARSDHNHAFGSKSVPADALALGPTFETALPGSPVDGQEIYYQATGTMATNGIVWHLRYRSASSSSYKWEFVGGPSLSTTLDAEAGPNSSVSANTWFDISTVISVTVPLAGDYLVRGSSSIYKQTSSSSNTLLGISTSSDGALSTFCMLENNTWRYMAVMGLLTGISASQEIKLRFRSDTASTSALRKGSAIEVRPVRLG